MKKPPHPHADAYVIARARLTQTDFDKINASIADEVARALYVQAAERSARSASEDEPQ